MDDVIPEVVLIFRSQNPNFWILRSFLRQNRSMLIFLKSVLSLSKTISSLRYPVRNTWFSERCPRWRHKSDLLGWSVFLNPQKWPTLKLHNFVKNQYFLMRFFFVWIAQLRTIKLANKNGGLGEGRSAPLSYRISSLNNVYSYCKELYSKVFTNSYEASWSLLKYLDFKSLISHNLCLIKTLFTCKD